jgi:hypothetical protein
MITRASIFVLILLAAVPLWSQTDTPAATLMPDTATADTVTSSDDARMLTPPGLTGATYPTAPVSEERSNFVRAGIIFNSAYDDNVLGGVSTHKTGDVDYSVWPTITLDQTTTRLHSLLTYAPGFTFYQRITGRNETDQNATMDLQYRLSPHVTASFRDSFQKSSNVFNQPDVLSAGAVNGSSQVPTVAIIAPVADRLTNTGTGDLTYQFSRSEMVGGGGTFSNLHYPNSSEVPGLFDSNARGGSAFYSRRIAKKHYLGVLYQYSRIAAFPVGPEFDTQTHAALLFYTVYLTPNLSLSLAGGPQHYEAVQPSSFDSRSWSPIATASLGWQGRRTTFAAGYSRSVTAGGGLVGAFNSSAANASARWHVNRTWSIGSAAGYAIYKNVTPLLAFGTPGGHSISGSVALQHAIGDHFNAEAGYTRLHQSFSGVAVISGAPDTNREFISISYQFNRALGR